MQQTRRNHFQITPGVLGITKTVSLIFPHASKDCVNATPAIHFILGARFRTTYVVERTDGIFICILRSHNSISSLSIEMDRQTTQLQVYEVRKEDG